MMNRIRKMKNSTLAMEVAAATILKKPNIPATKAIIRKINDHFNMRYLPFIENYCIVLSESLK